MTYFRARHSSWYQVPVLYGWWELSAGGAIAGEAFAQLTNGHGNGDAVRGDIT
jgi:hypothetical protein